MKVEEIKDFGFIRVKASNVGRGFNLNTNSAKHVLIPAGLYIKDSITTGSKNKICSIIIKGIDIWGEYNARVYTLESGIDYDVCEDKKAVMRFWKDNPYFTN